jgi:hypothetical protein
VEEVSSNKILSPEEQACEMHYTTHTTRESTRRYNVRLPFKTKSSQLGDTYGLALKRFLSLARSLRKKPTYGAQYQEFLSEYKQLGHMFEIPNYLGDGCYVSHHAVIKADSVPKVRVVFDASARSSSGKSLNDLLIIGPTIQDDLFALTIRFRTYKYVFAADIAKMYRRINIHPEDRRFSNNTRQQSKRRGDLTVEKLQHASKRIIGMLQKMAFSNEIQDLVANATASKTNQLIALNPFMDAEGIIRVGGGGRLAQSELQYEQKHPAVLPQYHHVTDLIIREAHINQGHSGVQGTLHAVRQTFWPVNGRVAVKSVIRKCVLCHRMQTRTLTYPIGQLPVNRVRFSRPFLVIGIDYCGPFYIK